MQRILVTGGATLLGSHLCEELLARGNTVLCADQPSPGQILNLSHLLGNRRFAYLGSQAPALERLEVDEIYHLPCSTPTQFDPAQVLAARQREARAILQLAKRTGARVLLASSSQDCGAPASLRTFLERGQRRNESLFFEERRLRQFDLKVARCFNPYGPQRVVDDGCVVAKFMVQALQNQPLTLHRAGQVIPSLCYVDDLVAGLIALMASPEACTGPVNLGSPGTIALAELAGRIIELSGSRSQVLGPQQPRAERQQRPPDLALARRALGWEPRTSLEAGLRWTMDAVRWRQSNVGA